LQFGVKRTPYGVLLFILFFLYFYCNEPSPVRSLRISGSAPSFPHQIAGPFLGSGVFTGYDLSAVVELARYGIGSTVGIFKDKCGRDTIEVYACDLESANDEEGCNVKAGGTTLRQLWWDNCFHASFLSSLFGGMGGLRSSRSLIFSPAMPKQSFEVVGPEPLFQVWRGGRF
jgi:hypothetical protein